MHQTLVMAAEELVQEHIIPQAGKDCLAKPAIPRYRFFCLAGMAETGEKYFEEKILGHQPYLIEVS